jgi:hypothetical protein
MAYYLLSNDMVLQKPHLGLRILPHSIEARRRAAKATGSDIKSRLAKNTDCPNRCFCMDFLLTFSQKDGIFRINLLVKLFAHLGIFV